jgi:trimethylamine--corrinoid protein Co-methyltransferase
MIRVLTDEQVESIHEASLEILRTTGVRFDSEDARRRLMDAGTEAHRDSRDVIVFPSDVVESALGKAPREFTYFARDRENDIHYDGEHCFPYAGGGDPKFIDLETGVVRPSVYADVEDAARLGDALDNNHFASHLVVPTDAPPRMIELRTMEAGMKNSSKVMSHHATSVDTLEYMVKMWSCVAGGDEELRKRPLFSLASSPSSPLTYAEHVCDVLIHSAELGVPFSVIPCPITGETGPVTLGGSLALQNAELLAGMVLIQSIAPKLPSVYCGRVCFMDPRTGRDLWGVPEEGLASAAMVQLARRYNMVADSCGMASDVTRWDIQLGFERMMTALLPMMAGTESISGIGSGWEGASSLEMMVIDNEVFEDLARIMRGVVIDDARLGLDVIDKVGHMGSFLAQPHTMTFLREGEFRVSSLWDKRTSERASRQGFRPLQEEARERARKILKEHQPTPLDRDVSRDVDAVLREAQKNLA